MKTLVLWLGLAGLAFSTHAQQVAKTVTTASNGTIGFLEFRPTDYGSQKHPLIIFLHGIGERGDGTTQIQTVAANGIPRLCAAGATMRFKVNGQTSSFVVLSPQLNPGYGQWPTFYVKEMIKYALANLSVDPNRIYVTGLSLGGGGTWDYGFESQTTAAQIAALAPVCGTDDQVAWNACASAGAANLPIWAFHCQDDGTVPWGSTEHVRLTLVYNCNSYAPMARFTYYKSGGHGGAWNNAYDTGHIVRAVDSSMFASGLSSSVNMTANPNLYEWFLTKSRSSAVQVVASAGADQSITLPLATVSLNGSGSYASSGTIASYLWSFVSGPSTPIIATPTLPVTAVVSLVAGVYKFQLTVTSNTGVTSSSTVSVTVNGLVNQTPSSNAGADQTITLPTNSVSLDGGASKDPDGTLTSYAWTTLSGPAPAVFSNATGVTTTANNLIQGTYKFQLTVTDNANATSTSTVTVTVNPAAAASKPPATVGNGTGLQGDYYNSMDLSGAIVLSRTDANLNFNWAASPGTGVNSDYFSVRWTGQVLPQYSETYTFYSTSDDGIRVWVNGQKIIDNWTVHAATENSGSIALTAGVKYDIKVEFFENEYAAVSALAWSSPSTTKAYVPQSQLFPPAATVPAGPAVGNGTGLKGDYYNTTDLSGAIVLSRTDATVNFNWADIPGTGVNADYFSTRWSGQVLPQYSETYTFYTTSDDGIRVWVNGQKVIDNWTVHAATENSGTISLTAGVKYDIKVEFFENQYAAVAALSWSSASTPKAIIPQSQLFPAAATSTGPAVGNGTGLKGDYYNTTDLSGAIVLSRTDATVNFNWADAPGTGIGADYFSTRWTGQVLPQYTETYTFYTTSDDGIRVWVNGQLVIDNWTVHAATENSGTITLTAGVKYDIKVEFFENAYAAIAMLSWSSASTPKAIIPQSQLFPAASTPVSTVGTGLQAVYYNTNDLSGTPVLTRTDANINFHWPASPATGVNSDYFSVRWTGQLLAQYSETYIFYMQSDDGVRVWVNGQKIIDNWTVHAITENTAAMTLTAGVKYDIVVEYFENTADAWAVLSWSSASTSKIAIPQSQLFPPAGTAATSAARVATMSLTAETSAAAQNQSLITVKTGIAPNPVSGGQPVRININSSSAVPATIQVISGTGNLVYAQQVNLTQGLTSIDLSTSRFAKGFYIINVIREGKKETFKMIVQ